MGWAGSYTLFNIGCSFCCGRCCMVLNILRTFKGAHCFFYYAKCALNLVWTWLVVTCADHAPSWSPLPGAGSTVEPHRGLFPDASWPIGKRLTTWALWICPNHSPIFIVPLCGRCSCCRHCVMKCSDLRCPDTSQTLPASLLLCHLRCRTSTPGLVPAQFVLQWNIVMWCHIAHISGVIGMLSAVYSCRVHSFSWNFQLLTWCLKHGLCLALGGWHGNPDGNLPSCQLAVNGWLHWSTV